MTDGVLLDAGVLLALYDPRHVHHDAARTWFAGVAVWATTPITETAFVRLLSNPVVMGEEMRREMRSRRWMPFAMRPGIDF